MTQTSNQSGFQRAVPLLPAEISRLCNKLSRSLTSAETFEVFKTRAAELLSANGAIYATKVILGTSNQNEASLELLFEQAQTAENIQQWAVSTAVKASTLDRPVVETTADQSGKQFHMVVDVVKRSNSSIELVATLFQSLSDEAVLETMLIHAFVQASAAWHANQTNHQLAHLAQDTAALVDLRSRIEKTESVDACFDQIVNELCRYVQGVAGLKSSEVMVFASRVEHGQASLTAVSNSDTLPQEPAMVAAIESAAGECVCRNQVTKWPFQSNSDRHATLCHQRLAEVLQTPYLVSVLLHDCAGTITGVLTLAATAEIDSRAHSLLASAAQPLGATIELVQRAEQNHLQKMINRMRESFKTQKAKNILKCLAGVVLIGLVPLPYQVASECELQPTQRRYVCTPYNSHLSQCHVQPGDIVTKYQTLATLDEREIRMELAEVEADFNRASKKRDGFVASHESGEASLADSEAEALKARNDLLSHRAQHLEVKSPIHGVVIEGDHDDNIGMPLETGQSLFQIAPLEHLDVEVFVSDAEVRYVETGMHAKIRLGAFPFETWTGKIERIAPAAEIRNENSVFIATLSIENLDGRLRPGMTGSAKISTLWRPIAWNWLHQPISRCLRWVGW